MKLGKKVYDNTPNIKGRWKKKELNNPYYIMDKLDICYNEAEDVISFDNSKDINKLTDFEKEKKEEKKALKKPTGIQTFELDFISECISRNYKKDDTFQNKDIHKVVDFHLKIDPSELGKQVLEFNDGKSYTVRQTPSRLKKLKELGFLKEVGNSSPKTYSLN